MTHPSSPSTDHGPGELAGDRVARRGLLRGGAVLVGAAGLAVASSVAAAPTAHAADGESVTLGADNASSSRTRVTIGAGPQPALSLANTNRPALELNPLPATWNGQLGVGQIASQATGPIVGADLGAGPQTSYVALEQDLDSLSLPAAVSPARLLDTRTFGGREMILGYSSATALDSAARLRGGQWLDLGLAAVDEVTLDAIFANVTVTGGLANGYLTIYPPGTRPTTSSINFVKGQTIANGGLFATTVTDGYFSVRVFASATTHVLLDVTGFTGPAGPATAGAAVTAATATAGRVRTARRSAARRTVRALGRR